MIRTLTLALLLAVTVSAKTESPEKLAASLNAFGLDLFKAQLADAGDANLLISPYSAANALALAYAGAAGDTHAEFQRVLHLPKDDDTFHTRFGSLAAQMRTPALACANQLFVARNFAVRPDYLRVLKEHYDLEITPADLARSPEAARLKINSWVEEFTHNRIRNLLPAGSLNDRTRLVFINALYFKDKWQKTFDEDATKAKPFTHVDGRTATVPTMHQTASLGYLHTDKLTLLSLPYKNRDFQLLILLPNEPITPAQTLALLDTRTLQQARSLQPQRVSLYLPKFKIESAGLDFSSTLKTLGLKTAFDEPARSADFSGIAPRTPNDYLYIDKVIQKTWIAVDEESTEAAAATGVAFAAKSAPREPITVRVDHPFLFALQHVPSGTCVFLGSVTDPAQN